MRRRDFIHAACAGIGLTAAGAARAQIVPGRTIRIVVPFAAGGATDAIGRIVGQRMSQLLSTPVVIENRAGANGNIGAEAAARAEPDGHTLLLATAGVFAVNQSLYRNVSFDTTRDLAPISGVYDTGNVLLVRKDLAAKSAGDLVDLAKSEPGKLTFASGGVGSSSHMFGELFQQVTGARLHHVPYRSNGPALNDLLAGVVDVFFDQIPSGAPQAQAGSVRALAVTTKTRSAALPGVPTFSEAGQPKVTGTFWVGMAAPARTPPAAVGQLNEVVRAVLADPSVKERLTGLGADPMPTSPEEFGQLIAADIRKWRDVVTAGNLQP
jgi:tripartite-type tricarboxylate transporter receptor subunit TctC